MDIRSSRYSRYALCKEMYDTADVIRNMPGIPAAVTALLAEKKGLFITGEGSSRLVPAKHAIATLMKIGARVPIFTEGATQALDYDLSELAVIGISNSGKTRELIRLLSTLQANHHSSVIGITANAGTIMEEKVQHSILLHCGKEQAVAATKSVVEQALIIHQIVNHVNGVAPSDMNAFASAFRETLDLSLPHHIIAKAAAADMIYFAGKNDGVAEELTLKTNEIARRRADYLEGTYAIHGIEEVMQPNEVVFLIDPFPEDEEKFHEVLSKGVGMEVIAIAPRKTSFETIVVPSSPTLQGLIHLAAGWNLLVEIGLYLGIDLDKPVRARKIGNEYVAI